MIGKPLPGQQDALLTVLMKRFTKVYSDLSSLAHWFQSVGSIVSLVLISINLLY